MSPNGRRAWREWVRRQDLRRKHKQPKGSVCRMARQARRHIPLVPGVMLPKFITARSLVGMSASAKKRAARALFVKQWCRGSGDSASCDPDYAALRSKYRIGERLRPCPGCPQCTDDPLRIVKALSRRMKLRMEIHRCNSSIIPSKFDYLAMLHRPGPAWNPVCGFGPMRQDAVRALCDVILREGAEEFQIPWCDGSGVLPARNQDEACLHRGGSR